MFSCKSNNVSKTNKEKEILQNGKMITEKSYNSTKTHLLIVNYKENLDVVKNFDYKVIEVESKKTVLEGTFSGTKLVWHTNNSLKGFLPIGIIHEEDNSVLNGENPKEVKNHFKIININ